MSMVSCVFRARSFSERLLTPFLVVLDHLVRRSQVSAFATQDCPHISSPNPLSLRSYGTGPIVHFASDELKKRFLPDLLTGRKRIALAITEPKAGSDVSNLSTSAELSSDGKHYIVNGVSAGLFAEDNDGALIVFDWSVC